MTATEAPKLDGHPAMRHWGSVANVEDEKQRKFVSQPYGSRGYTQALAQDFADRHGLSLEVISPAIWYCTATTFVWTPQARIQPAEQPTSQTTLAAG